MSVELLWEALRSDIPSGPKLLLVVLADHADGEGVAYPGQTRLCKLTSMSLSTVQRHSKWLEEANYLTRWLGEPTSKGKRDWYTYRLLSENWPKVDLGTGGYVKLTHTDTSNCRIGYVNLTHKPVSKPTGETEDLVTQFNQEQENKKELPDTQIIKLGKKVKGVYTSVGIGKVWKALYSKYHPGFVKLTQKEQQQLNGFAKEQGDHAGEVLACVISSWVEFTNYAKDYGAFQVPMKPSPAFLRKFSQAAHDFWKMKSIAIPNATIGSVNTDALDKNLGVDNLKKALFGESDE